MTGRRAAALREAARGADRLAWDGARFDDVPEPALFDPGWWRARGRLTGEAAGRGAAWFVDGLDGRAWVLRHNRRGGVLAHLNHDRFLWTGGASARSLAELRLLAAMRGAALPVPAPVAARAARSGPWYRGDVITERIAAARPLAEALERAPLEPGAWRALGVMLARFHCAGIRHADLNARNVLVDAAGDFHLIDFDKARHAAPGAWCEPNLARLRRSLAKSCRQQPGLCFAAADWQTLRAGYAAGFAGAA